MSETVHKATLSSGKIVYLKEMDNKKEELAFQAASGKAGNNEALLAYYAVGELVKLLLAGVQKKDDAEIWKPTATDLEMLDKHLTYVEMKQVREVIGKLMGEGSGPSPVVETVLSGTL